MIKEEAKAFLYSIAGDLGFRDAENYTCKDGEKMREAIMTLEEETPCCEEAVSRQVVKELMIKYGFHAPDMTVTEFVEDLPSVTQQQKYEDIAKAFQFGMALGFGERHDEMDKVIDEIKKVITPQPKWIPVSEGLPKEYKTVIASTDLGVYPETRYSKEYGWEWAYEAGADYWKELAGVTAWMPLPKQYEPESEK